MNILSKLQVLLLAFLLCLLGAFIFQPLLVIPAVLFLAMQLVLSRGELRREYPEDWVRYSAIFVAYEGLLVLLLYFVSTVALGGGILSGAYNILLSMLVVLVLMMALRLLLSRRHTYGDVIFSTADWVGVSLKSDLLSRVAEADYAVRNPGGLKLRKGDRVRVRLVGVVGKARPVDVIGKER